MEVENTIHSSAGKTFSLTKLFSIIQSGWFSALAKIVLCLFILFYVLYSLKAVKQETANTQAYVTQPKVGDIYFINYQSMSAQARPNQRFRLGKLVDITGDTLTLKLSSLYYMDHKAIEHSIHYGQLRYSKYFESKRYNYKASEVNAMVNSGAIYMVQRPIRGNLYGSKTSPDKRPENKALYIPGKSQNNQGVGFLNAPQYENNLELAFKEFSESANLNYAPGQVNLAEMYLNGRFVDKDLSQSLFWLKQASLQSHKPAILKYVIVCGQVQNCHEAAFYQELLKAGVSIKVRQLTNSVKM